jgi:hypothetical protein
MTTAEALRVASEHLSELKGTIFDVLSLSKPNSTSAARNLAKIISKLSPLVGNLIEFNTVEYLNSVAEFHAYGTWRRQDPGFPDTIFEGKIEPIPGLEIKAWFPLSTEITARFRDSQVRFSDDSIYVAMLAWMPEYLIFGSPLIVDVGVFSARSVAVARDTHYHNPPDYIVIEPEDTQSRTANLQQTNTAGYKFQGSEHDMQRALRIVESWGHEARRYSPSAEYQARLRQLVEQFRYRLDTNYAKMDRIVHEGIEDFKSRVLKSGFRGRDIQAWAQAFSLESPDELDEVFSDYLDIKKG